MSAKQHTPWALCTLMCLGAAGCDGDGTGGSATSSSTTSGGNTSVGGAGGETSTTSGSGGSAGSGGAGGSGGSATPPELAAARCGLSYGWLPPSSVGAVVSSDTPHSSLGIAEALAARIALGTQGLWLNRTPAFETLAHRVVYTTQDRGQLREATTLVIVPQVSQPQSFPVLLFHHGTTGLNDTCAPSYGIEDSSSDAYAVALLLSLFSSFGYVVVAPDYLGQKSVGSPSPSLHPYLIGEPTAIAAWDSVRAAQQLVATDASSADLGPVALWGASQGGHAAMFSAAYQPYYAPEMDLRTGVYAVPPSDLESHMTRGTRELHPASGNAVLFYAAADAWYQPALSPGLSQIFLPPLDTQVPLDLATECSPSTLDDVTTVDEVFTSALIAACQTATLTGYEPWGCFLRENSLTTTSLPPPTIPGMFIVAENDTLVLSSIERASFNELCAAGHELLYRECAGADHEEGFFWAIDDALDYIDARLAGQPGSPTCTQFAADTCSNMP